MRAVKQIIVALIVILLMTSLTGCLDFTCDRKVLARAKSPNGSLEATVLEINCGATTPFYRHIMLHRPQDDYKKGEFLFVVRNQPAIHVAWNDENTLLVQCSCSNQNISRQVIKVGGTTIKYSLDGSGPDVGRTSAPHLCNPIPSTGPS